MKPKIGLLAFLVILLMIPASVFAAASSILGITSGVDAANSFGAGEYGVIGSFKVTDSSGSSSSISNFILDGTAATLTTGGVPTILAADIDSVAIWWDKNRDGILQRDLDTYVIATNTAFGSASAAVTLTSTVTLTANEVRYFMVVVLAKETPAGALEGATADVKVTVTDGSSNTVSINNNGSTWSNDTLNYVATHLQWVTAGAYTAPNSTISGYKPVSGINAAAAGATVAKGANFVGPVTGTIIKAVDDFGNTDKDFAEGVQFAAYNYSTLEDVSANLTAKDGAGTSVKVGTAAYITNTWNLGLLNANTGTAVAGALKTLSFGIEGPVILVAMTQTTRLEGTVTVLNAAAYTTNTTVNAARGIEIYDADHDGSIDHATVFYNSPISVVNATNVGAALHVVGGTYAIDSNWAARTKYDAGGTGIENAGEFGLSIKFTEKAQFDTDAKPDLYIDNLATTDIRLMASATALTAFSNSGAVEVDKAQPILIKAETQDVNANGMIDAVKFTFSEAVRNVTAGADTIGKAFMVDPNDGVAFTGTPSVSGSVVTISLTETTPNTGLKPTVVYNQNEVKPTLVTDFATSATNAPDYNFLFPVKTNYAVKVTFATRDAASMVVHTVKTLDLGGNGRLETVEVVFSEAATVPNVNGVGFYSSVAAFASGTASNGIYTINGSPGFSSVNSSTYRFTVSEVTTTDVYDTESLPRFSYSRSLGDITDAAGNELLEYGPAAAQHPSTTDGAAPVMIKILTGDAYTDTLRTGASSDYYSTGANGRIDNV